MAPDVDTGYVTPTSPVLYATVSNITTPASTIDHVDFLDGDMVIGTVTTPNAVPTGYAFIWQDAPVGMHSIAARATNSLGYSATSSALSIYIIGPDPPPQVALTAPTTGQIFAPASTVPLAATASSTLGTIQRVEFVTADRVIDTALSPPYTASWINPPPGNFAIVAKAYDDIGVAASSLASYIQVLATPRSPSVVLTAPAAGAAVASGAPLLIAASALAPDGDIGRIDFYAGTTVVGSASSVPYEFTWTNPNAAAQSLTAKAYDLQGNVGVSAPVALSWLNNRPPTVTLRAPANGAQFTAPATIPLGATASDPDGSVSTVDFFAGSTKVATATAPFDASWTNVGPGSYTLTAVATDNLGATATSTAVTVSVVATALAVNLTAPTSGARYSMGQTIVLTAQASAPQRSISHVDFFGDGSLISSVAVAGGPSAINVNLTWTGAALGAHALSAKVFTADGASATSAPINVMVTDLAVNLTEPYAGQLYQAPADIRMTAVPTETGATIARVDFYGDGGLLGSATTLPYSFVWHNAAEGAHSLRAHVVDSNGAGADSPLVTVSVQAVLTTSIEIVSPVAPPGASASLASDFVTVHGRYVGPANTGITVNGVVAEVDGAGHFAVNGVSLDTGDNVLNAVLTTLEGSTTTQGVAVSSTATAPFQVTALPEAGFAPLTVTLWASSRNAGSPYRVNVSNLGGGTFNASTFDGQVLGTLTFNSQGIYTPLVTLTYGAALTYTQTIAIIVRDGVAMDTMFIDMFNRFTGALSARNKSEALQFLTEQNRPQYGAAIDALDASLPDIVTSFKAFGGLDIGGDVAQYALKRSVNGKTKVYLIEFLRDGDGVWRLDSW